MNKFFIDKVAKIKMKSPAIADPATAISELKIFLEKKIFPHEGFVLKEVEDDDVEKSIKTLKGKKSCGMDWICGYTLKLASKLLVKELGRLINISIRTGKFYSGWKCSKVLPGYKNKGSAFDAAFYRPIANLSEVSKLAEKAVHQQVHH